MKGLGRDIMIAFFMGVIVPAVVLRVGVMLMRESPRQPESPSESMTISSETVPSEPSVPPLQMLLRGGDGTVAAMDMDAYLLGAVLAEMPASFEPEALKAQAVAARTYTQKAYTTGGKHGDGSVCGNYACCQAYISEEDYIQKGGTQESVDKVRSAVEATSGYVLTYDGALIEATYFSCSGGRTEDAAAVWGAEFPYLQAVDSPGEENAAHYTDTVYFTPEELQRILGVTLTGDPLEWIGSITYTEGGGIAAMEIGGTVFTGTELRSLLSLRSTAFTISPAREQISITTRGFGHRVGMSQYGADAMAVTGSDYTQILAHYYPGTTLQLWEG